MTVYNFSAGPATLPKAVLKKAQTELLDYQGSGMSVMEMSHRSGAFQQIIDKARANLRLLMAIPDNYEILFLQGGASTQFAMIPLNLMNGSGKADFVLTGAWSKKALAQAEVYGDCRVAASSEARNFYFIPELEPVDFRDDADYAHITFNNTIYGTEFNKIPDVGDIPLVADMSSNILSAPVDVSKFALIYAGAQKNIGPAGVTVVIIRKDLIGHARKETPIMLDYKTHADKGSMYNTPLTFSIYMAGLVFEWLLENGGLDKMAERNRVKASLLYGSIDESAFFSSPVNPEDRSKMNVPFVLKDESLEAAFLDEAAEKGLLNLKGHRAVGGMRASIYNAMPLEGVEALVEFMKDFEMRHG